MIHIYTAELQPATNYVDCCGETEIKGGYDPEKELHVHCCGEKRLAKDCVIQCYYDHRNIWCAPNKGCNDPQVIAERKAREFEHRSTGQKARWAKKKIKIDIERHGE